MLNPKKLQYKILLKEIKGISPKLSIYNKIENEIKKLAEELEVEVKEIVRPNWDNNIQVLHYKHKVKVGTDSRTSGAVFDKNIKIGKMNSQST